MREILFRGKRADNGEWVSGYYCRAFSQINGKDSVPAIQEVDCFYYRAVDPSTVGQYTGLADKTGKKVFEGDILRETIFGNYFEVWYDEKKCAFMARCVKQVALPTIYRIGESFRLADRCAETIQIIGNAHDNPELLGVIS